MLEDNGDEAASGTLDVPLVEPSLEATWKHADRLAEANYRFTGKKALSQAQNEALRNLAFELINGSAGNPARGKSTVARYLDVDPGNFHRFLKGLLGLQLRPAIILCELTGRDFRRVLGLPADPGANWAAQAAPDVFPNRRAYLALVKNGQYHAETLRMLRDFRPAFDADLSVREWAQIAKVYEAQVQKRLTAPAETRAEEALAATETAKLAAAVGRRRRARSVDRK